MSHKYNIAGYSFSVDDLHTEYINKDIIITTVEKMCETLDKGWMIQMSPPPTITTGNAAYTRSTFIQTNPKDVADSLGLEYFEPLNNQLLLDIDDQKCLDTYNSMIGKVKSVLQIDMEIHWTVSNHGKLHIYITMFKRGTQDGYVITDEIRVALQTILGSDSKRDLLSIMSIQKLGTSRAWPVSVLFEAKNMFRRMEPVPIHWDFGNTQNLGVTSVVGVVKKKPLKPMPIENPIFNRLLQTVEMLDRKDAEKNKEDDTDDTDT